jgi:hypothetical protein
MARLDALENDQGGVDAFGADDNDEEVVLDSEGGGERWLLLIVCTYLCTLNLNSLLR